MDRGQHSTGTAGHGKILNKTTLLITIKSSMTTEVSENETLQCLHKNIEESILINFDEQKIEWEKSLEGMPVFTVREIDDHKNESGEMVRQLKRLVREAFNLKMSAI